VTLITTISPVLADKRSIERDRNGTLVVAFSINANWFIARAAIGTMLLAVAGFTADRAGAEIIKKEDTLRGITMTRDECDAKPETLWLNVYDKDFCVRYYLSTAGGQGNRPVIILNGDSNGPVDPKDWSWKEPSTAKDVDTDKLVAWADKFSKLAKTTAIYIGRIGVEGTSGSHLARKTLIEVNLMDMVLDALRKRYEFEGFHLVGQSGGGRLVFGVAEMRSDVGCLISSSGAIGDRSRTSRSGDPGRTFFDVMSNTRYLSQNSALRMIVLSDPKDQQVPMATKQTPMVDSLRKDGHDVLHLLVEAAGPKHHGALAYGAIAMGGCVLQQSNDEIAQAVDARVSRKAEINRRRQDELRDTPVPQTTSEIVPPPPGRS
jgi:pimeloyl-ACP methyl ester carboxylesterase